MIVPYINFEDAGGSYNFGCEELFDLQKGYGGAVKNEILSRETGHQDIGKEAIYDVSYRFTDQCARKISVAFA